MAVCCALLVFFLSATVSHSADLHTLSGETITGDVVSITNKEVVIAVGGKNITTPLSQVLNLEYNPPGTPITDPFNDVELVDGSLLHCETFTIDNKDIELKLLSGQKVKFPLAIVANILREAQNEKFRAEWNDKLTNRRKKKSSMDAMAVRDQKTGKLIALLDVTLGEGNAAKGEIDFTFKNMKRQRSLTGVAGLIFEREVDPNAPPIICKVTDAKRNLLMCSSVVSTSAGLVLTTPAGAKVELKPADVTRLDYNSSKLVWLSDLEPTEVVEKFLDNSPFHYKRDRSQEDGPIRMNNVTYAHGLSLHATTELEYDLKGEYREFRTVAGINELVGGLPGQVVLRIEGDGKVLKQLTFDRRDKVRQQTIAMNVKDVQKLRICVVPGGEGLKLGLGLHLDLGDVQVSK